MRRLTTCVFRIAVAVRHQCASLRTEYFHFVTFFCEGPVGVAELRPPEANRPAGLGAVREISSDKREAFLASGHGIDVGSHGAISFLVKRIAAKAAAVLPFPGITYPEVRNAR